MEGSAIFSEKFRVSRETMDSLSAYEELLLKWNPRINLISKNTVSDIWERHMVDSAQLTRIADINRGRLVDLGSGAGFPGMVLAILAKENDSENKTTLIETDIRKCEFIRTVARETDTPVNVISRRIEDTPAQSADIITSRALSSLSKLMTYAEMHLIPDGRMLLHKGRNWRQEVEEAKLSWSFQLQHHQSMTDKEAAVLEIWDIKRA